MVKVGIIGGGLMHSDAVISIAASENAEELMHDVYKGEMGYLPWKRPGLELGLMLRDLIEANPAINSALMGQHGFICWADTWEECYELTLRLINQAAEYIDTNTKSHPFGETVRAKQSEGAFEKLTDLLPSLRGKVAFNGQRLIAKIDQSDAVLEYLSRTKAHDLAKLGTSCPDHFLRTKIRPLILEDLSESGVDVALADFRKGYAEYYDRCKRPDSPTMAPLRSRSSSSGIFGVSIFIVTVAESKSARIPSRFIPAASASPLRVRNHPTYSASARPTVTSTLKLPARFFKTCLP